MSYCPSVRSRWLDIGQQVLFSLVLNNGLDVVFALYNIYYKTETKLYLTGQKRRERPFLAARGARGPRVVTQMAGFANFGHSCYYP